MPATSGWFVGSIERSLRRGAAAKIRPERRRIHLRWCGRWRGASRSVAVPAPRDGIVYQHHDVQSSSANHRCAVDSQRVSPCGPKKSARRLLSTPWTSQSSDGKYATTREPMSPEHPVMINRRVTEKKGQHRCRGTSAPRTASGPASRSRRWGYFCRSGGSLPCRAAASEPERGEGWERGLDAPSQ